MPDSKHEPWRPLRQHTAARIAVGRAGGSLPTDELLDFRVAHASAVDSVYAPLDMPELQSAIQELGCETICVESAAPDRNTYLQRPDLGRQLDAASREALIQRAGVNAAYDVALIVSDGLSATAAHRQAVPLLTKLVPQLACSGYSVAPIAIVRHGRVAVEDEIGAILGAKVACIVIGERPGLGTPDSLGAYIVYEPKQGKTNAQRNCVSNIRPEGLPFDEAAALLMYLIAQALRLKVSGIELKDERGLLESAQEGKLFVSGC